MSLMIGCHAQATSTDIVVDHTELEGARWFERGVVAKMLMKQHPEDSRRRLQLQSHTISFGLGWRRGMVSSAKGSSRAPHILCTGIAVLDEVFRVGEFPIADTKGEAVEFVSVGGGCAANAAVAVARLGGRARFAGPLGGPPGKEASGDRILAGLAHERVDCAACVRVKGVPSSISAIVVNARGE